MDGILILLPLLSSMDLRIPGVFCRKQTRMREGDMNIAVRELLNQERGYNCL
jgi:hypothetical protein